MEGETRRRRRVCSATCTPLGDSPCRSLADSGARVPKVLPTAELEGFLTGLIIAMPLEPVGGAAVGDDVEEAQELAVKAPAGGDDAFIFFDCWWALFDHRAAENGG